jgi:hypothetical protein
MFLEPKAIIKPTLFNNKCRHERLKIYKDLLTFHVTELSIKKNEDNYHEAKIENDWSNEWDIEKYASLEIVCECGKKWKGKKAEDFPIWLQEVLEQEERHFRYV